MQPTSYSRDYLDAAHLLRRAAFGATPPQIRAAAAQGLSATTDTLLNFDAAPDPIDDDAVIDRLEQAIPGISRQVDAGRTPVIVAKVWWVYRMLASQRPLEEKMVLFWSDHFTSSDGDGALMIQQNQLYRKHALGNFRTLTMDVSKNPEMLRYLNNDQNYKAHPNENYARELMELFTCGRVGPDGKPNYTEDDVKASARAFSGWNLRRGEFFYNPYQHDDTAKTFMGHTGDLNGGDIVNILVALPATAHFICRKLFRAFAYEDPEPQVMDALVKTYFDSGYEIRPIVSQILRSNAFYSPRARWALIKSPAHHAVGTARMLGIAAALAPPVDQLYGDDPDAPAEQPSSPPAARGPARRRGIGASPVGKLMMLVYETKKMGQDLMAPPTVKGWDGGAEWINTDTLQNRSRLGAIVASLPELVGSDLWSQLRQSVPPDDQYAQPGGIDSQAASAIIDTIATQIGPLSLSDAARATLMQYAQTERVPQLCARGLLSLMLGSPEYQVC